MKIITLTSAMLFAAVIGSAAADEPGAAMAGVSGAPATTADVGYLDRTRELVMHALAMIGVNYKFGGVNPAQGFDCSGLVMHVFREVAGLMLPRDSKGMSRVGDKIDKTGLQPGDLVFFNTRRQPYSHVGIYIGDERFVHAPSRGRDVEIADMRERYWQARYNGARRVSF